MLTAQLSGTADIDALVASPGESFKIRIHWLIVGSTAAESITLESRDVADVATARLTVQVTAAGPSVVLPDADRGYCDCYHDSRLAVNKSGAGTLTGTVGYSIVPSGVNDVA